MPDLSVHWFGNNLHSIHFIYYLCFLFFCSILDRLTLGQILAIARQYYFCNLIVIEFLSLSLFFFFLTSCLFIISLRARVFSYFMHCSALTPCPVPTYSTFSVKTGRYDINLTFFNLDYIFRITQYYCTVYFRFFCFDVLICYFEHLHFFSFCLIYLSTTLSQSYI